MAARTQPSPHIKQANWLFVRLAPLLVGIAVLDALLGPFVLAAIARDGLFGAIGPILALVLSNLVALWFAVHLVFTAFDGVLEAKLESAE